MIDGDFAEAVDQLPERDLRALARAADGGHAVVRRKAVEVIADALGAGAGVRDQCLKGGGGIFHLEIN